MNMRRMKKPVIKSSNWLTAGLSEEEIQAKKAIAIKCENCLSKNVCRYYPNGIGKNLCCSDKFTCPEQKDINIFIQLPCKVGDTVYPLNADIRFKAFIEKIEITANELLFYWVQYDIGVDCTECWDEDSFTIEDIGKTVFLDEVEYLIALKEYENSIQAD